MEIQSSNRLESHLLRGVPSKLLRNTLRFLSQRHPTPIRNFLITLLAQHLADKSPQVCAQSLRIIHQRFRSSHHRFGWNQVMKELAIGFPESKNGRLLFSSEGELNLCFEPFLLLSNYAPGIPGARWTCLREWMQSMVWKAMEPLCKGVVFFCESNRLFFSEHSQVPTYRLNHPHPPIDEDMKFSFPSFIENKDPKIVFVGAYARNPVRFAKARLPGKKEIASGSDWGDREMLHEFASARVEPPCFTNYKGAAYDTLLRQNLIVLDFHEAGANNGVIDCMVRATPVLVNPLPAVVEYLGPEYPLYFNSVGELEEKARDLDRIEKAHRYLLNPERTALLSSKSFIERFHKILKATI